MANDRNWTSWTPELPPPVALPSEGGGHSPAANPPPETVHAEAHRVGVEAVAKALDQAPQPE